jgi:hypothetical protein
MKTFIPVGKLSIVFVVLSWVSLYLYTIDLGGLWLLWLIPGFLFSFFGIASGSVPLRNNRYASEKTLGVVGMTLGILTVVVAWVLFMTSFGGLAS